MSRKVDLELGGEYTFKPMGCLSMILFFLVFWALLFGVTVDGKHYGLDLSCNNGITIIQGEPLNN